MMPRLPRGCCLIESIWAPPWFNFYPDSTHDFPHMLTLRQTPTVNHPLRNLVWLKRLLQQNILGQLRLTEDFANDSIPRYAILLHPLRAAAEEVTFRDPIVDPVESEASYDDIVFCGEQARRVDLRDFWVDTNTSLPRPTNSMFRWYHNATQSEGPRGKASWRELA